MLAVHGRDEVQPQLLQKEFDVSSDGEFRSRKNRQPIAPLGSSFTTVTVDLGVPFLTSRPAGHRTNAGLGQRPLPSGGSSDNNLDCPPTT